MKLEFYRSSVGLCRFDPFRPELGYDRLKGLNIAIWEVEEVDEVIHVEGGARELGLEGRE